MATRKTANKRIISRRSFLAGAAAGVAAGALAACGSPGVEQGTTISALKLEHLPPALPSPQPPIADGEPTTPETDPALPGFLALSAVLTGIGGLSPTIGSVYLASLQANKEFGPSLARLLEAGGFAGASPPETLETLESTGLLDETGTTACADKIVEYWYSGVYDTPDGEQAVATFVDALAWQAITYTKPLTLCGAPGYWSEAPELTLD